MTITEFHTYRKVLLTYAEKGHPIVITRNGKTFLLTCTDTTEKREPLVDLPNFNSDTGTFAHEFDDIMATVTDFDKFNEETRGMS